MGQGKALSLGDRGHQRGQPPAPHDQANGAAEPCEQQAFGEQLLQQPSTSGAERGANAELAGPHRRARQHQAGDVGAGHEQHDADRGEQYQESRSHPDHHLVA